MRKNKEIPSLVYDPSCVLYLPLWRRDGASFMSDDAYGHNCTVTGATWGTQGRALNGSSDKISLPHNSAFNITTALTIIFSFKSPAGDDGYIINKGWKAGELGTEHPWSFINVTGGTPRRIQFSVSDNSPLSTSLVSNTQLAANAWHHVAGVATASTLSLYFEGVLEKSVAFTGLPLGTNTAAIYCGARNANGTATAFLNGTVGEYHIFSRALSPLEIMGNFNEIKWRYL